MIVATTGGLAGRRLVRSLAVVGGNTVRVRAGASAPIARPEDLVGGKATE